MIGKLRSKKASKARLRGVAIAHWQPMQKRIPCSAAVPRCLRVPLGETWDARSNQNVFPTASVRCSIAFECHTGAKGIHRLPQTSKQRAECVRLFANRTMWTYHDQPRLSIPGDDSQTSFCRGLSVARTAYRKSRGGRHRPHRKGVVPLPMPPRATASLCLAGFSRRGIPCS